MLFYQCNPFYVVGELFGATFAYKRVLMYLICKMFEQDNFNEYVCESFFDFNRDLNGSNDIIENLYNLMIRICREEKVLFQGLERRLRRAVQDCRDADDFLRLINTTFRHRTQTSNKQIDIALVFFLGEWLFDQMRIIISEAHWKDIKSELIKQMKLKLSALDMLTRMDWYLVTSQQLAKNDEYDYAPLAASVLLTFVMNRVFR